MAHCNDHNEEQIWIELSPGRKVLRCLSCHNGVASATKKQRVDMPLVKYAQNFHRDRPFTDFEKKMPGGKAKKPQW